MKSKLGITLRKIRNGKQISLCSLADEHLSKSQISRFERGESEISCIRLINILDKLHITLDEFLILHDEDYANSETFANLVQYIRKQYSSQNINNIAYLLSDTSIYTLNSFEKTMVKSILHTMDSTIIPSDEELLQLTDYLFKVEKWGYYEIILFGNCVRTLSYNSYFLLTKEMLNNYIYSSLNKTNKRIVTQLAINCLILSIDKEEFSNCSYLIGEIKTLLNNELNFYEQTVFLYATGYFEFKRQSGTGIEKMKQAIQVLDILGEDKLKLHYTDHLDKLVNKE
ncbi:Rgg family transcriptional regulator [Streptococcus constellatus subsp. pharyngis]|uniref:DNA-binding helix-turn-helix protein n=1 Tax=Streptococcus constellatus subsp. pharyngis SK1060 = CCUG 46377 TaxID=1035184 RepID=F9P8U9_STRCV|nr:Rgg/GadR/MutR family transcriptional regulator [Streptococcus constellatus]AGU72947.1 putative transcriptional regulator [Streptococcus constellatus subsp. pharyngis C232]AGU74702.1 putative transcriptional regulator [Streptococcus constellatus subsp. pharyngis C818]EGV07979.1 DNA-binding helix-turn-helix protein [Streptococcus constellatus subsp. pharyngis SK1060 = CCUG 46377]QQC23190.1 Rgg/GadR/MutR family transcriptional regulator [Streptococcus constellatus]QRP82353.1 Rgg/GadR/MutR fami